jgi:hypothetical protein
MLIHPIVKKFATVVLQFTGIVFVTGFIHWILVNLYIIHCAPAGIRGILQTFISLGSPLCQFINTVQYELARHYITIWAAGATAILAWIIAKTTNK